MEALATMDEPKYSFDELIQSKLFTFYIGEEKKEFTVHSKAIAATSQHFHALVDNGMTESQTGSVEYPETDPGDFARFVEYAYRHDYTVPSCVQEVVLGAEVGPNAEDEEETPPAAAARVQEEEAMEAEKRVLGSADSNYGLSKSQQKKKAIKQAKAGGTTPLGANFERREYLPITARGPEKSMLTGSKPENDHSGNEDFTPVFLAHARLYTFACMRLIHPLEQLTLHKLHKTLLEFKLNERRVGDLVELAKYAYQQGEDRKDDGAIEPLRKLVVEHIVREIPSLGEHKAFTSLLYEGGEFVVDFWHLVCKEKLSGYPGWIRRSKGAIVVGY